MGGLGAHHRGELARLAARYARTGEVEVDGAAALKVGTRLVRDWQGTTHQVLIQDGGYLYRDKPYRSLSQVARAITGTSWSGSRFFGLRRRTKRNGKKGASNS